MSIRNTMLFTTALIASALAGCRDPEPPVSHHTVRAKVWNIEAGVDDAATVIARHFNNKIEEKRDRGDDWFIRSGYDDHVESNERTRRWCECTIIPLSDTAADVEVTVLWQRDESDTGYGERSVSNPKWGVESHDQEMERRILNEVREALEKAQAERR